MLQARENLNVITPVEETEQERQIIADAKRGSRRRYHNQKNGYLTHFASVHHLVNQTALAVSA